MSWYSVNTITRSPRRPARKPSSQPRSRVSLLSSAGVTFSASSSSTPTSRCSSRRSSSGRCAATPDSASSSVSNRSSSGRAVSPRYSCRASCRRRAVRRFRGGPQALGAPLQAQQQGAGAGQGPLAEHFQGESLDVVGVGAAQGPQHPAAVAAQPLVDLLLPRGRGHRDRLRRVAAADRLRRVAARHVVLQPPDPYGRTSSGSSRPSSAARCGDSSCSKLANDSG